MKSISYISLLVTILIGTSHHIYGGNDLDSLKQTLEFASAPGKKAKILLAISDEYSRHPDSLLMYAEKALSEARNTEDSILMFRTAAKTIYALANFDNSQRIVSIGEEFLSIEPQVEDTFLRIGFLNILGGFGYFPMGKILKQLKLQEQALTLIEPSPNFLREASMMAYNLYQGYYSIGQPEAGTIWMEKIHKRAEQFQDSSALIQVYILMGQTTDYIERERGPISYFFEAYNIAEQIKDTAAMAEAASFLGQAFERSGSLDSAIIFLNKAIHLEEILENITNEMFSRYVLGKFYNSSGQFDLGLAELKVAKEFFTQSENLIQLIDIQTEMSLALIGTGDESAGVQLLTQMVDSSRKYEYQKGVIHAYTNLATGYEMIGAYQKAINAKDSLLVFQRRAFKIQQEEISHQLSVQTESQQKELENAMLRLNNLNLKAKNRRRLNILTISIFAVLSIGMLSIFLRNKWKTERTHRMDLDHKIQEQTQHLSDSIQKLTEANEDLRKFTFLASHNFKTSIRTVKSMADLLKKKTSKQAPEHLNFLNLISSAGTDMNNTLDSLTAYFNLRESEVHFSDVDLRTLYSAITKEVIQQYPEKNPTIRFEGHSKIQGNPGELTMMLRHLIDNAIKYQPPGQEPEIIMYGKTLPTGYEFRITDNGLGINPAYQEQIFEAFTRLHPSSSYEGVGIGLAIIKRIVDRHQATISVESQTGEGSTFIIQFPKFPDSPQR